jgi:hypothetical protein
MIIATGMVVEESDMPNYKVLCQFVPEVTEENHENVWSVGRDSNLRPPEYQSANHVA